MTAAELQALYAYARELGMDDRRARNALLCAAAATAPADVTRRLLRDLVEVARLGAQGRDPFSAFDTPPDPPPVHLPPPPSESLASGPPSPRLTVIRGGRQSS